MTSGRSIGLRYWAFMGMGANLAPILSCPRMRASSNHWPRSVGTTVSTGSPAFADDDNREDSRKQNRRQPLAAFHRGGIGRPPGLEKLHELFARAVLVPFAVAFDDRDQLLGGFRALALGVECGGEIE